VLGEYSQQDEVFAAVGEPLVAEVLKGFNATIFAYGQTGTGKTHTMEVCSNNSTCFSTTQWAHQSTVPQRQPSNHARTSTAWPDNSVLLCRAAAGTSCMALSTCYP
jgi:hypothetical protein